MNQYNINKIRSTLSVFYVLSLFSLNIFGQTIDDAALLNVRSYPMNNELNINPDVQLKLHFPTTPIVGMSGKIRVYDASNDILIDSLDMSIPPGPKNSRTPPPYDKMVYLSDSWDPANGYTRENKPQVLPPIEDQYQHKYIGGTEETDIYHFYPILINDSVATITLHKNLEYGKTYYVLIDSGVLSFADNKTFAITRKDEWVFSIKNEAPDLDSDLFIVSADGNGDFNTVQGVLAFIPDRNHTRKTIFLKKGIYQEIVYFRDKENITIVGEDREKVIIAYPNNGFFNPRPTIGDPLEMVQRFRNRRAIFAAEDSNDIHLVNFTILSIGEAPAQNEGLLIKGERNIVHSVTIDASGDALQASGLIYIENSSIKGYGDNVLGYGTVFFKNCEFISTFGPHLWVRNTSNNHGNILVNCTLRTEGDLQTVIARAGNATSGFPYAEAVLINCRLEGIRPEGWGRVGPDSSNVRYWEFNSVNLHDGKPVDTNKRASYSKQLTMENDSLLIENYSNPKFVLNGWNPQVTSINNQQIDTELPQAFQWWDIDISRKPYSWYTSETGRRATENILSWQYEKDGWPLMNTIHKLFTGDINEAGTFGHRAALVKATVNELRFLSRAYKATGNERCKASIIGGLNYILEAQHDSGSWPKSYPNHVNNYMQYGTFNDDVIHDLMTFLKEVISSPDFTIIGKEKLEEAKEAYNRGLDFILKSQINVAGKLTAWAQQHDTVTYEPKAARAFEPIAISGGESANILLFLMDIRDPSPQIKHAIESGVRWYKEVQINGLELAYSNDDVCVRSSSNAPPLWARFYEIGTNKPIFAGRDGIIRYNLSEVQQERRRGYSWYNQNGTNVLDRYTKWLHERAWDSQPPTNVEEENVVSYILPDPLIMMNGSPVLSTQQWERERRPEIIQLFEQHQHGVIPEAAKSVRTRSFRDTRARCTRSWWYSTTYANKDLLSRLSPFTRHTHTPPHTC